MNAKLLIPIIAATFFTLSAQAHDCSGGTDGGMDATGNQCNDTAAAAAAATAATATEVSSDHPTSTSARPPKADTNKAPAGNKSTAKRTNVTRDVPAASQVKHS